MVNEPFISDKWTKTTFYYNPSLKDKLEYIYTPHIEGPEEITGTWSDLYEYGHAHSFPKAPSKMELWVRVKGVEGEYLPSDPIKVVDEVAYSLPSRYELSLAGGGLSCNVMGENYGLVNSGAEVIVTITPPAGKRIKTFNNNGNDVLSEITDNTYTFTLDDNTYIAVTYEDQ